MTSEHQRERDRQRHQHFVQRGFDEHRAIDVDAELRARRQVLVEGGDLAHTLGHLERVGIGLGLDADRHARDAIGARDGALVLGGELDIRHVRELHEVAIGPAPDDEVAEVLGLLETGRRVERELARLRLDAAGGICTFSRFSAASMSVAVEAPRGKLGAIDPHAHRHSAGRR